MHRYGICILQLKPKIQMDPNPSLIPPTSYINNIHCSFNYTVETLNRIRKNIDEEWASYYHK